MTIDDVLDLARSIAGDVDPMVYRYTREALVDHVERQRLLLAVRQVAGMADLVVDKTQFAESITPAPTDEQGAILATAVALAVLQETYRGRVDRGEIGLIWRSGLEEESTVAQEKAYRGFLADIERQLEELKLIARRTTFATRPQ